MTDDSIPTKCTCGLTSTCAFVPPSDFQYELGLTKDPDYDTHSTINQTNSHKCICRLRGSTCLASSGTHKCMCIFNPEKCMLDCRYSSFDHECICKKVLANHDCNFFDADFQKKINLTPEILGRLKCRATISEHHTCICSSLYEKCASKFHCCSCETNGYDKCRLSTYFSDHRCICHTGKKCHAPSGFHQCMCRKDVSCQLVESYKHSYKHECRCNTDNPCIASSCNHKCICGPTKHLDCRAHALG